MWPGILASFSRPWDECAVATQFRSHDPNTDITDFKGQPTLPPVDPNEQEPAFDRNDSFSMSLDNNLPTAEPPILPQTCSMLSRKF